MKKYCLFTLFAILLISQLFPIQAQDVDSQIQSQLGQIGQINEIGKSLTNSEIRAQYLKEQWTKIIESNKIIGPIHKFFTKISIIFQIIFAEPYSLSLTLICVIILWLFVATKTSQIVKAFGFVKSHFAILIGIAFAIVLAQARIYRFIVKFAIDLALSPEMWWARLLIVLIIIIVMVVANLLIAKVVKIVREKYSSNSQEQITQKLKEMKALSKGLKG